MKYDEIHELVTKLMMKLKETGYLEEKETHSFTEISEAIENYYREVILHGNQIKTKGKR